MSDYRAPISHQGKVDADLIERCHKGDADAWDALFDKYYPVAARFVFQLSADFCHEDTEEICQETFLAVVRNLRSFQGKSSFQTWLLRIAANKAMDFRGKSHAEKRGGSFVHFSLDGADVRDQVPPGRTVTLHGVQFGPHVDNVDLVHSSDLRILPQQCTITREPVPRIRRPNSSPPVTLRIHQGLFIQDWT